MSELRKREKGLRQFGQEGVVALTFSEDVGKDTNVGNVNICLSVYIMVSAGKVNRNNIFS